MTKSKVILLLLLVILTVNTVAFAREEDFANSAKAACVMERDSERVLYAKNENAQLPMASTTKIVTAIVVIENCSLDDIVTINKEAVGVEGSSVYLKEGEKWTVKDLLYGLMLRSGNDCAVALAYHVGGNIATFVQLMNDFAKKINCTNTHFVNANGLHDNEHYTCALDLAKITCYALRNCLFSKIVSTKSFKAVINGVERVFVNKNKLLCTLNEADGVKTGYTKKAGRCFVGSATKKGMQIVCVVLNDGPMFEDCQSMLSKVFELYDYKTIIPQNKIINDYSHGNRFVYKCEEGLSLPISRLDNVKIDVDCKRKKIFIFLNENLFKTINLVNI